MSEPLHRHFGVPLSDWINAIPNELEFDGVGLWQIIPVFRDDFGLAGSDLKQATVATIIALLSHGARPVIQGNDDVEWVEDKTYSGSHAEVAERIAREWIDRDSLPGPGDLWFSVLDER